MPDDLSSVEGLADKHRRVSPATMAPSASGEAEFDLSDVPAGGHEMSLIAWAPDASAKPVSLRLPPMTIRPGSRRDGPPSP